MPNKTAVMSGNAGPVINYNGNIITINFSILEFW